MLERPAWPLCRRADIHCSYLIEPVHATMRKKGQYIWAAQHIILRRPCHHLSRWYVAGLIIASICSHIQALVQSIVEISQNSHLAREVYAAMDHYQIRDGVRLLLTSRHP